MKQLTLKKFLKELKKENLLEDYSKNFDFEKIIINYISCNSKDINDNSLFICKGAFFKKEYFLEAVDNGAVAYISKETYDINVPYIKVKDVRKALSIVSKVFFSLDKMDMKLIGVTGTKGKSTTSYYIKSIIDEYLRTQNKISSLCGINSSIDNYDGTTLKEASLTTPESIDLYKLFYNAQRNNMKYFVSEVSSSAFKYNRVYGLKYDIGVFLNIGYDHISPIEHIDYDDYLSCKLKLLENSKIACININSKEIEKILYSANKCEKIVTFGLNEKADIYGYNTRNINGKVTFNAKGKDFDEVFTLPTHGFFNVENALAAIAVAKTIGIDMNSIKSGLFNAKIKGRMEVYTSNDKNITAIVDYAHNGMSLEKVYASIKEEFKNKNIITIIGSDGGKAFNRRKEIGMICSKYSKKIYLTTSDTFNEKFESICSDIVKHISTKCKYEIIEDRTGAIKKALSHAGKDDIILVAGKGAEMRQILNNKKNFYISDSINVKRYIDSYNLLKKA